MDGGTCVTIFITPNLVLFLMVTIVPLFAAKCCKLFGCSKVKRGIFVKLGGCGRLFAASPCFLESMLGSFVLTTNSLFVRVPVTLFLTVLLTGKVGKRNFCEAMFFLPMMVSDVMVKRL